MTDCDRLSGRSRIGTDDRSKENDDRTQIAIVFRGDRGLEQAITATMKPLFELRSSFGAIEDWNADRRRTEAQNIDIAIVFRGDRGLEPPMM